MAAVRLPNSDSSYHAPLASAPPLPLSSLCPCLAGGRQVYGVALPPKQRTATFLGPLITLSLWISACAPRPHPLTDYTITVTTTAGHLKALDNPFSLCAAHGYVFKSPSIRVFALVQYVLFCFFQQGILRLHGVNIAPVSKIGHSHCRYRPMRGGWIVKGMEWWQREKMTLVYWHTFVDLQLKWTAPHMMQIFSCSSKQQLSLLGSFWSKRAKVLLLVHNYTVFLSYTVN